MNPLNPRNSKNYHDNTNTVVKYWLRSRTAKTPDCKKKPKISPIPKPVEALKLKRFRCPNCIFMFSTNAAKQRHMRLHSGIGRSWKCGRCSCAFMRKAHLRQHEIRRHVVVEASAYQCQLCKLTFKSRWNREEHMKIHTGTEVRSLLCSQCPSFFTTLNHLNKHQMDRHQEPGQPAESRTPTVKCSNPGIRTKPQSSHSPVQTLVKLHQCKIRLSRCDGKYHLASNTSSSKAIAEGVRVIRLIIIRENSSRTANGEAKPDETTNL